MYVVTGSTGNTGSVVVNRLLAAGKEVRGIGRSRERLQGLRQKGGEPFVADLTDREALADAFSGAEGVYVMNPPDATRADFRAHQDAVSEAIGAALERTKVKHVVSLSSFGADKAEKTGPVVGLYRMEQRLNRIAGLNVLHLRAGYFMENTLVQTAIIPSLGKAAGPVLPELKLPMIATLDVGTAAAEALLKLDFNSHQTRELLGQRDITMSEVATILGNLIGKPDLQYIQASEEQFRTAMLQMGMSGSLVGLFQEMALALNTGYMKPLETRNARNTTPTSFETFARQEFVPKYQGRKAA
jgi:uncharacterized protein YbjT (DUF2867 family)